MTSVIRRGLRPLTPSLSLRLNVSVRSEDWARAKAAVAFPRNNDLSSPTFLARVVPIPQFSEERRGARACDEILIAKRRSVGRAEDFRRNWKRNGKWRDACWNRRPRSHRERRSEIRSDGCSFVEQRSLREFLRSLVIGLKSNSNVFQLSSDSYTMFNQLSKIIQLSLSLSPRKNSKLDPRLLTLPKRNL